MQVRWPVDKPDLLGLKSQDMLVVIIHFSPSFEISFVQKCQNRSEKSANLAENKRQFWVIIFR